MTPAFKNEALTDFTIADNRDKQSTALTALDEQLARGVFKATPLIDGKSISVGEVVTSVDPADPALELGAITFASVTDAEHAISVARAVAPAWSATPFQERATALQKAAAIMREKRFLLTSLTIREAGKSWPEADGDIAEGIDFCDYYASEMLRLGAPQKTSNLLGEDNSYFYQPRGVVAVIAPWNFPFAIACGMTAAALVSGNPAILKPAEQTTLIAFEMVKIFHAAGIPGAVLGFLPGWGETVGRTLTASPNVDMIVFTGSKAVGLEIIKKAGETSAHQHNVKKVVAEMGGKNAVIVDEDADLDEAVKGVLHSAFGYAGQKCSACSRVLIVGDAYETFLSRFAEATRDIVIGAPRDSGTFLGPVIDEDSQRRIFAAIAAAEKTEKCIFKGTVPATGFFVPPTIFRDVDTKSPLWRNEIFGPVVACRKAASLDEALELANESEYALTGGIYSRSPSHIDRARVQFKVGNLYINRKITGALVSRQPFGGFRMSGIGSKAGGPDYLLQFMEPRVITENTMRRGFAA